MAEYEMSYDAYVIEEDTIKSEPADSLMVGERLNVPSSDRGLQRSNGDTDTSVNCRESEYRDAAIQTEPWDDWQHKPGSSHVMCRNYQLSPTRCVTPVNRWDGMGREPCVREVITLRKRSDPDLRRLVRCTSWSLMVADALEEFELPVGTKLKFYMLDDLTPIKEKFLRAVVRSGVASAIVEWCIYRNPRNTNVNSRSRAEVLPAAINTVEQSCQEGQRRVRPAVSSGVGTGSQNAVRSISEPMAASSGSTQLLEQSGAITPRSAPSLDVPASGSKVIFPDPIPLDTDSRDASCIMDVLPIPYPLPAFPTLLHERITLLRSATKTRENLRNWIVKVIRSDMMRYRCIAENGYPSSENYKNVCYSLIRKYPFLRDTGPGCGGIESWSAKLQRSFRTYRKSVPQTEVMLKKQRTYAAKAARSTRSLETSPLRKKVTRILDSSHVVDESLLEALNRQSRASPLNETKILELLKEWRAARQRLFRQANDTTQELQRWPALLHPSILYHEVLDELGSSVKSAELECQISSFIVSMLPEVTEKLKKNQKFDVVRKKYTDGEVSGSCGLALLFRDDLRFFMVDMDALENSPEDVSRQLVIVIDDTCFHLALDRKIFMRNLPTPCQAISVAFCLHFIFNLEFSCPSMYSLILYFVTGNVSRYSIRNFINRYSVKRFS